MTSPLDTAKDVLSLEIAGLEALRDSIGDSFIEVFDVLQRASGRIIVTGMGKSGHVARKIAATFASTGTPAIFVHPGEASHGDLGMISREDVVLALSKSGETAELRDVLAYAARFSIPVAALTAERQSTLAKTAEASLILPISTEACDETRAPTTSTTMMMAAGDALAVALLRARGFTADDFKGFHPGGRLGAALQRARDLMNNERAVPLTEQNALMDDVITAITAGGLGCVGVIDKDGALRGIITDGDLRRHAKAGFAGKTALEIMTRDPRTISADALAGDVLALMSKQKITALFVVENRKPVGVIHVHDCLSIGVA